jgi:hypothetical protein
MGSEQKDTLRMIIDAGFHIVCDENLDVHKLLETETVPMKSEKELHPAKTGCAN